jgi:hypothetical protein
MQMPGFIPLGQLAVTEALPIEPMPTHPANDGGVACTK